MFANAPLALSGDARLGAAILFGIVLGFVLIKSDLIWRKSCLDLIKLRSPRLLKTILLAIAAGVILFYFARQFGWVGEHVRPGYFWGALIGGAVSGIGFALCAMTPVTSLANLAAGRLYAVWALIGMLLAIPVVSILEHFFSAAFDRSQPLASTAVPDTFLSIGNPVLWVAGIAVILLVLVHFCLRTDSEE